MIKFQNILARQNQILSTYSHLLAWTMIAMKESTPDPGSDLIECCSTTSTLIGAWSSEVDVVCSPLAAIAVIAIRIRAISRSETGLGPGWLLLFRYGGFRVMVRRLSVTAGMIFGVSRFLVKWYIGFRDSLLLIQTLSSWFTCGYLMHIFTVIWD